MHLQELGLCDASDADIFARAIADDRIIMTSNADDFRKLGAPTPEHPGLAIMFDAVGRAQPLTLGVGLADAIDNAGTAHGRLFEIDRQGVRGLTNAEEGIIIKFLEPARRSGLEKPVVLLKVLDLGRIFESAVSALVPYR